MKTQTFEIPSNIYDKYVEFHERLCAQDPRHKETVESVEDEILLSLQCGLDAMASTLGEDK